MKGIRILVVEDDLISYKIIKKYLSKEHKILGNAISSEEAVTMFQKTMPDLVIMDIHLEGIQDGIHSSELLCDIKSVPVIYITGTDSETMKLIKERILESHPYAFLRKPLNFEELKMVVELSYEKFQVQKELQTLNEQLRRISKEAGKYQFILQTALEDSNILIWEYDLENGQYMVSGSWLKQLAVNRDNELTQILEFDDWCKNSHTTDCLKMKRDLLEFLNNGENGFEFEYRVLTAASHYVWIRTKGKVFKRRQEKIVKLIGTHVNITDRKAAERQLETFASQDSLTKTFNRKIGMRYLNHQILKAKKGKIPFTAAYVDIDGLKKVNDTYGHDMGDELILQMVSVFKHCLRETDIISRLGGDEFLLIFPNCNYKNAEKVMIRINSEINTENIDGIYPFLMSLSYGMQQYDESSRLSSKAYLSLLDQLMYDQKKSKGDCRN